ncbi:hypothetical protein IQ247_27070 [Plectonema cf. radiosum LEGE 06105]|uniref:Uncharacterized protein n=1 Tax=Plectonema cf. radiosum LEGE 06105 TaxID=945769 RepID=A0A8J7JX34_9CYAN|nr:hypothetical protein [Plectonema radiosum]MBE9216280.1 hypothetical protein [Plectonema cf. radiosum LEGE 06105]
MDQGILDFRFSGMLFRNVDYLPKKFDEYVARYGIIAHLYGLTEGEFGYILSTFPIVAEETKQAALSAYRDLMLVRVMAV